MHLDSSGLRTREGLSVFSMTNFILFVKVVLIKKLFANTHTHGGVRREEGSPLMSLNYTLVTVWN